MARRGRKLTVKGAGAHRVSRWGGVNRKPRGKGRTKEHGWKSGAK